MHNRIFRLPIKLGLNNNQILLVLLFLSMFTFIVSKGAVPPLLPLIKTEFNLGYSQAGLIVAIASFMTSLIIIPAGWLSDKIGRKKIILPGIMVLSLATLTIGFSQDYIQLLLGQSLIGCGMGLYSSTATSWLSDVFPKGKRGKAIGFHESAVSFGYFIAPILVTPIAGILSWRYPFFIFALLGFIVSLIFWRLVKEPQFKIEESKSLSRMSPREQYIKIKEAIFNSQVVILEAVAIIVVLCFYVSTTFLPLYLIETKGIGLLDASTLAAIPHLVGVFSRSIGGTISDKHGRKRVIIFSLIVLTLSIYLLIVVHAGLELVLVLILFGSGASLSIPVAFAFFMDIIPSSIRATAWSFLTAARIFIAGVGIIAFGMLIDVSSFEIAFISLGVLATLATIGFTRYFNLKNH